MPINKRGGKGYSKNPRARKEDLFKTRYNMTRKEWASFKKSNPKEAHELRLKVVAKLQRSK